MPTKWHLQVMHRVHSGKWINFSNPKTFTEKLQWLKINRINPLYEILVDKIAVKEYVSSQIGQQHVIPTIRIFKSLDEITIDALPDKFVLKTNHAGGGGGVFVCRDKTHFDINRAKDVLAKVLKSNWYQYGREYPYRKLTPQVFCEQLLESDSNGDIPDFKFYCFNGKPEYCQVIQNRSTSETIDFYDMDWQRQEFWGLNGLNATTKKSDCDMACPENFVLMKELASILSKDIPFVRVDLYNVNGKIYFGELTFFPASGFGRFTPDRYNLIIGNKLQLR